MWGPWSVKEGVNDPTPGRSRGGPRAQPTCRRGPSSAGRDPLGGLAGFIIECEQPRGASGRALVTDRSPGRRGLWPDSSQPEAGAYQVTWTALPSAHARCWSTGMAAE